MEELVSWNVRGAAVEQHMCSELINVNPCWAVKVVNRRLSGNSSVNNFFSFYLVPFAAVFLRIVLSAKVDSYIWFCFVDKSERMEDKMNE